MRNEKLMPLLPIRNSKPIKLILSSRFLFFYLVVWPISAWHHPPPFGYLAEIQPSRLCGLLWASVACCGPLWPAVGLCGLLWASVACCGPLWSAVGKVCGRRAAGGECRAASAGRKPGGSRKVWSLCRPHTHMQYCYPALREDKSLAPLSQDIMGPGLRSAGMTWRRVSLCS